MFDNKPSGWDAFKTGESISSKGILTGVIHHPHFGAIQVADIHVVANYGGDMKFEEFRRLQLQEASQIVRERAADLPIIIGGDFNVAPVGNSYTPLWDELVDILPGFERFIPKRPVSTRSKANPYSEEEEGQLDHIFGTAELKPIGGEVTSNVPGMFFSDHFGWETTFVKSEDQRPVQK
jgi:endonuclease/exonuclease/phosphatase family metal-dependent hydrolase